MDKGRRVTSAVKTLKDNYQPKEGVRDWKVSNQKKEKKIVKIYEIGIFFPPSTAAASSFGSRSHTSSNVRYFQTPQIASGSESQRINQNIALSLMNIFIAPEMLENGLQSLLPFHIPG